MMSAPIESGLARRTASPRRAVVTAVTALCCGLLLAGTAAGRDGDRLQVDLTSRLFDGLPHAVVYADPYVYIGLDSGVQSFDVSDIGNPIALHHVYLDSPAYDLASVGDELYVANGEAGMTVIDVADPMDLLVIGVLPPPAASAAVARGIAIDGATAYVAESASVPAADFGLRIVDVTTPTTPMERGFLPLDNGALSVAVDGLGGVALVGIGSTFAGRRGLVAVDVSTPASPAEIGFLDTLGLPVHGVVVDGAVAYLATGLPSTGALVIADVGDPMLPAISSVQSVPDAVYDVALRPGVAFAAASSLGVIGFDVSVPSTPAQLDALPLGAPAVAVVARNDAALVGVRSSNGQGGLTVVDALSASALDLMTWSPYAEATAAAGEPGVAYLLRRDALHIFDISAPQAPLWLGAWGTAGGDFSSIDVEADLAAIGEGQAVHLIDVSSPLAPTPAGTALIASGVVMQAVIDGNALYVVTGDGLEAFDITVPSAPSARGSVVTTGWATDLAVEDLTGYLVAGDELLVLDLAAPTPTVVGGFMIAGEQLVGVDVAGTMLVLTGLGAHLYTADVTLPTAPALGGFLTGFVGRDVRLLGDRAVVAAGVGGVRVIDVSDPLLPVEEAFYDTSGAASVVGNDGDLLLVAGMESQHWLLDCATCNSCPGTTTLTANTLKLVKPPTRDVLSWNIAVVGNGVTNIHRTLDKTELPDIWMQPPLDSSATNSYVDPFLPPGLVAFYQVFGADCAGNSVP